jgi:hypothetical protein
MTKQSTKAAVTVGSPPIEVQGQAPSAPPAQTSGPAPAPAPGAKPERQARKPRIVRSLSERITFYADHLKKLRDLEAEQIEAAARNADKALAEKVKTLEATLPTALGHSLETAIEVYARVAERNIDAATLLKLVSGSRPGKELTA